MPHLPDIDFSQIASRGGSKSTAFEELCCQLAHKTVKRNQSYTRLNGAGGDGGIECFADLPDGSQIGWQAKYVFDVDALIGQTSKSLATALNVHKNLAQYTICFPFDPTGATHRGRRNAVQKLGEWCRKMEAEAVSTNPQLHIKLWPKSEILGLMLKYDSSGGLREYFFDQTVLSDDWFSTHVTLATKTAGPRYSPELNVETDIWKWFAAFGRTAQWSRELSEKVGALGKASEDLATAVSNDQGGPWSPAWPASCQQEARATADRMSALVEKCSLLSESDDSDAYHACVQLLRTLLQDLATVEGQLLDDLKSKYGSEFHDTMGWRGWMSQYNAEFPAENLDESRRSIDATSKLLDWLASPRGLLAFERAFALTGVAGSGKTHGICDIAVKRLADHMITCVLFGSQFGGEPDPWVRLAESLGLPGTLGMNGLLDALDAAAEASGFPCIIIIDAVNETQPLPYWYDRLPAMEAAAELRSNVRICVTCRTSFVPYCIRDATKTPVIEHQGFASIERKACDAFFRYYGISSPVMPLLRPEYSNPLYLRMVCETAQSQGLHDLPSGWLGLTEVIGAFIGEKEKQFARNSDALVAGQIVRRSLSAVVRALYDSGKTALPWSEAESAIANALPNAGLSRVLDWLVRSDLLLQDIPLAGPISGAEPTVRPVYERLGDFLMAEQLWKDIAVARVSIAARNGGPLDLILHDKDTIRQHAGILEALSVVIPEHEPGHELTDLARDEPSREELVKIAVGSYPWRDLSAFSTESQHLVREALAIAGFTWKAFDVLLSISWRPSCVDATFLNSVLASYRLSYRDAWWCPYLHEQYESQGLVHRFIDAMSELRLDNVDSVEAKLLVTTLLWFTSAADRRVKDRATRAATVILIAHPEIAVETLKRMLECDDDEVRERTLLSVYGALIATRDTSTAGDVVAWLHAAIQDFPGDFDNAVIRDDVESIAELTEILGAHRESIDLSSAIAQPKSTKWPLSFPPEKEIKRYQDTRELQSLAFSCLSDDFFVYTLECLRPWQHSVSKKKMARWILRTVVEGLRYEGSGCNGYDSYMQKYGYGRMRPEWAERIGKKYQWVAMYRLASKLHDHAKYRRRRWDERTRGNPMILLSQRKMDPTLPASSEQSGQCDSAWWSPVSVDLQCTTLVSDKAWVARKSNVPTFRSLLAGIDHDGERWMPLEMYASWQQRGEKEGLPLRDAYVSIHSYLVPEARVKGALKYLEQHDMSHLPQPREFLYGFAGEYPWTTAFKAQFAEPGYGKDGQLPCTFIPSHNEFPAQWEGDVSRDWHQGINVPAAIFFSSQDLWWNGRDGYFRMSDKKVVFRDPSLTESGPSSLLANMGDLPDRLSKNRKRLVLVLTGEKYTTGGTDRITFRTTFNQAALLNRNGSVVFGKRAFFSDAGHRL
ncbi:MAG: NACHT domain-containing protein [Candidatus Cryosericum sp.]